MAASNADLSIFLGRGLGTGFLSFSSSELEFLRNHIVVFAGNGLGYSCTLAEELSNFGGCIFPGTGFAASTTTGAVANLAG